MSETVAEKPTTNAKFFTIRRLGAEELESVRDLSRSWLHHCADNRMIFASGPDALDAWMKLLAAVGTDLVYVAEADGEIVGACFWHFCQLPLDPTIVSGLGTYVYPEYRRKGISSDLRAAAAAEAARRGASRIVGQALSASLEARSSAQSAGFLTFGVMIEKELA